MALIAPCRLRTFGRKQPTCHDRGPRPIREKAALRAVLRDLPLASTTREWQYLQKACVGDAPPVAGVPAGSKDAATGPGDRGMAIHEVNVTHSKAGRDDPAPLPAVVPL